MIDRFACWLAAQLFRAAFTVAKRCKGGIGFGTAIHAVAGAGSTVTYIEFRPGQNIVSVSLTECSPVLGQANDEFRARADASAKAYAQRLCEAAGIGRAITADVRGDA